MFRRQVAGDGVLDAAPVCPLLPLLSPAKLKRMQIRVGLGICTAGSFLWLAAWTGHADSLHNAKRVVGGQQVDLTPLFRWWTIRSGPRPLAAWAHVTGSVVEITAWGWTVQARVETSPAPGGSEPNDTGSSSKELRIVLRNPPVWEKDRYEALNAQLQELNDQRQFLVAQSNQAATLSKEIKSVPHRSRAANAEVRQLNLTQAQAKALIKTTDAQIQQARAQLSAYPNPSRYTDWTALPKQGARNIAACRSSITARSSQAARWMCRQSTKRRVRREGGPFPPSIAGRTMRITGGKAARRILKVPRGLAVRPTPDLVKQAVFNSLGSRVVDARVLELFAGTGALSLECLSRGAGSVVCVEKSPRHAAVLRENLETAGFPAGAVQVRTQDVFASLHQMALAGQAYDLVLADPPYGEKNLDCRSTSLAQRLLDDQDLPQLLLPYGLLVLGHSKRDTLSLTKGWSERKVLKHGDSIMRFLELKPA